MYSYVTCMLPYASVCIRVLLVCTRRLFVCTRMLLVRIRMSLECIRMLLVCTRMLLVCTHMLLVYIRTSLVCTRMYPYVTRISIVWCFSLDQVYRDFPRKFSYREFPFHLVFLLEFPGFSVKWFAYQKFNNLRFFWELSREISVPYLLGRFPFDKKHSVCLFAEIPSDEWNSIFQVTSVKEDNLARYTKIFEISYWELLSSRNFLNFRLNGSHSEIQHFPDFLDTFARNLSTISPRFEIFEIFGWTEKRLFFNRNLNWIF